VESVGYDEEHNTMGCSVVYCSRCVALHQRRRVVRVDGRRNSEWGHDPYHIDGLECSKYIRKSQSRNHEPAQWHM
jgi:hypothetical protein